MRPGNVGRGWFNIAFVLCDHFPAKAVQRRASRGPLARTEREHILRLKRHVKRLYLRQSRANARRF
jgi:hypothetical protein